MTKFDLINNADFMSEVINLQSVEEVQQKFAEKGVEISREEVEKLGALVYLASEESDDSEEDSGSEELSLDALDNVAGGAVRLVSPNSGYSLFAQDLGMSNDETEQLAHTLTFIGQNKKSLAKHSFLGVSQDKAQSLISQSGLDARLDNFKTL